MQQHKKSPPTIMSTSSPPPPPILIDVASDGDIDEEDEQLIKDFLEYQSAEESPDVIREQRHREQTRRLPRYTTATFFYVIAVVLIIVGAMEMIAAEHERKYGWELGVCRIANDFSRNDTHCIYFGAIPSSSANHTTFCAVPASIASATNFAEPPACHGASVDADLAADVAYWRSIRTGVDVECLFPTAIHYGVSIATCVASTTGGHSVAAVVWRTWIERLVYLIRTPREGAAAIEAVTTIRSQAGASLVMAGWIDILVVTCCVHLCCRPLSPVVFAHRRHKRRMAAHKMY